MSRRDTSQTGDDEPGGGASIADLLRGGRAPSEDGANDLQLVPAAGNELAIAPEEQLALLLGELKRIEGQQTTLQTAVKQNKAIVVIPRKEVLEIEDEPETPKPVVEKKTNVVSGGLAGFHVAADLLNIDFSPPEEAPEEFRAVAYNSAAPKEIRRGASGSFMGSFGQLDPASAELARFLQRLQAQQQQVMELIAEKESEFKSRLAGKPYVPPQPLARGLSGMGSFGLSALRSQASSVGAAQPSRFGPRPTGAPPTAAPSRSAAAAPAATQVPPAASRAPPAFAPAGSARPAVADANRTVIPVAKAAPPTAAAGATASLAVSKPKPPPPPPKPVDWAEAPLIELKFAVAQRKVTSARSVSASIDPFGALTYLFFLAAFGFYAYARIGHTVSGHHRAGIVFYEVLVLVAEALVFLSSALYGLCRVRSYQAWNGWRRRRMQRKKSTLYKETEPNGTLVVDDSGVPGAVKLKEAPKRVKHRWTSDQESTGLDDRFAVSTRFHVSMLVYSGSNNSARIQQCLEAAHAVIVPTGCTRTIYLLDPAMDSAKQQLVVNLGLECCEYRACRPDLVQNVSKNARMEALNRALKQLFPKTSPASSTEILAVFDDDQVAHADYLKHMLLKLEAPSCKLAHCHIAYANLTPGSDVFNQMEQQYNEVMLPGYEPWGYSASSPAGFLARVDALQKTGWLPAYADASGFAIGMENRIAKLESAYVTETLITSLAPSSVAGVYAARASAARERLQAHVRSRPGYRGHLSASNKLVYHSLAISDHVSALTALLFVIIPILRVLFNVFPFYPNRWFGLGFLIYYCVATPLLFKSYNPHHFRSLWLWTLANRTLCFTTMRAWAHVTLRIFKPYTSLAGVKPPSRRNLLSGRKAQGVLAGPKSVIETMREKQRERQLKREQEDAARDAESGTPNGTADGAAAGDGKVKAKAPRSPSEFPWLALLTCLISGICFGLGIWLLFGTHGVVSGSITQGVNGAVLANNLTLIISVLWCLAHTCMFGIPVIYALGYAGAYDATRSIKKEGQKDSDRSSLAFWSYLALAVALICALIAGIACLALGDGFKKGAGHAGAVEADFGKALRYSMYFYEAQKSGSLAGDNYVDWRGQSATLDAPPGGWYLGSNNLKLTFPMAVAATQIAWGLYASPTGFASSGQGLSYAIDNLQWVTNYLGLCANNGSYVIAQVGDVALEESIWARPEDMTQLRPTSTVSPTAPGSDLTGATIAALAATSVALKSQAYGSSVTALTNALTLYPIMRANEGLWSDAYDDASAVYTSTTYLDDMMLASAWMVLASGDKGYLTDAVAYFNRIQAAPAAYRTVAYDWNSQYWAACLLMWQITGQSTYSQEVETFLDWWVDGGNGVIYTPNGLAWTSGGAPLRNAANAAFVALAYGDRLQSGSKYYQGRKYACWGILQLRYILGGKDGETAGGQSFMVGYGANPPTRVPNPAASCPDTLSPCNSPIGSSDVYSSISPNPHVLYGALVAGPDSSDKYEDRRSARNNAISIEFNGGLSGALAIAAGKDWSVCDERAGFFNQIGVHSNR